MRPTKLSYVDEDGLSNVYPIGVPVPTLVPYKLLLYPLGVEPWNLKQPSGGVLRGQLRRAYPEVIPLSVVERMSKNDLTRSEVLLQPPL